MRLKVARDAPSRLTCTAFTPSSFRRSQFSGVEVVAVGLDLELAAARADVLDHVEEARMDHRLAAREREVGDLVVHQLLEDAEDLLVVELVVKRLAGPAFLDAVQAREVALVGDLPRDVERRAEVARLGGGRRRRRTRGPAVASVASSVTRSVLHQALLPQVGDERDDFALDRAVAVVEALLQPRGDRALVAARLDFAHHRGRGRD